MFGPVFAETMRAPFRDPEWMRKFLVGGLLSSASNLSLGLLISGRVATVFAPVLLVLAAGPIFVVWGYLYRIFVDALNGLELTFLPAWAHWKGFLGAGIYLFLIMLGYVFLASLGLLPFVRSAQGISAALVAIVLLLYGFFPIAFARFAAEGRLWAAFDPWALWGDLRVVVTSQYLSACLVFFLLWLAGNLVSLALPFALTPVVAVYLFYVIAVFARLFGMMIGQERQKALASGRR